MQNETNNQIRLILKDSNNRAVFIDCDLEEAPMDLKVLYKVLLREEERNAKASEAKEKEVEEHNQKVAEENKKAAEALQNDEGDG